VIRDPEKISCCTLCLCVNSVLFILKAIRHEIWRKTQLGNIAKKSKSSEDFAAFNEQKILVNISAIPDLKGLFMEEHGATVRM
jgi:hypothetical protein